MTDEIMISISKKAIMVTNPNQEKIFRKLCKGCQIIYSAKPIRNKTYPTYFMLLGNINNITAYENQDLDGCKTSVIQSGYTPMSLDYFKKIVGSEEDEI